MKVMSAEDYLRKHGNKRSKYHAEATFIDGIRFDKKPIEPDDSGIIGATKYEWPGGASTPRAVTPKGLASMHDQSTSQRFLPQTRRIDVTGQKFGRLTAVSYQGWNGAHKTLWLFRCDCGEHVIRRLAPVRRGEIKSCGCLRREGGYVAHNRKPAGESSFNALFNKYKRSAQRRGYAFSLTREEFRELTKRACDYCGAPPSQIIVATSNGKTNGEYVYTGVDRVDNEIGYISGNVVPCCAVCNRAKGTMTHEEFTAWVGRTFQHLKEAGRV